MVQHDGMEIPTPECDRMVAVAPFSQMIGDFLDWLGETGITLCDSDDSYRTSLGPEERFMPHYESYELLLARYFQIDLQKVEEERRAILAAIQTKSLEQELRKKS